MQENELNRQHDDAVFAAWGLPGTQQLISELRELASTQLTMHYVLDALSTGIFSVPDKCHQILGGVRPSISQAALIAYLASRCSTHLSIEFGFGMGMTAATILSARLERGQPFTHVAFDPFGLNGGDGDCVQRYLESEFASVYARQYERSQFGAAVLANDAQEPMCGLVLIDGDHHFDGVFADFYAADKLLTVGGFMVLDDARAPAIETVINFVRSNRADYEVSLQIENTAVLRKTNVDKRSWDHFVPFDVPQRNHWDLGQACSNSIANTQALQTLASVTIR